MFSELAMPQELVFGGETLTISSVSIPAIAGNETKTVADYHSPYNTTDIFYTFYNYNFSIFLKLIQLTLLKYKRLIMIEHFRK